MKLKPISWKTMCEHIEKAKFLFRYDRPITAKELFSGHPNGETYPIDEWYYIAVALLRETVNGEDAVYFFRKQYRKRKTILQWEIWKGFEFGCWDPHYICTRGQ